MGMPYSGNTLTGQKRMSKKGEVASEKGGKSREESVSVKICHLCQMLMRNLVKTRMIKGPLN